MRRFILALCGAAWLAGAGGYIHALADEAELPPYPERGLKGPVGVDRLPIPDHPILMHGRDIWAATCRPCHGTGAANAPKITGSRFWQKRIAQGLPVLFEHAKNGFSGSAGTMPARGGNGALNDADVEAAVRYMIANSGGEAIALDGLD